MSVTVNEADADADGVPDPSDNCPNAANPNQEDIDGDGIGGVCDPTDDRPSTPTDADSDSVPDSADNCPNTANPDQTDVDGDGIGDACDQLSKNKNKAVKGGGGGRPVSTPTPQESVREPVPEEIEQAPVAP